ncbi:hypothetical protein BKA81DRAFT_361692 [Phyllosticta paracitricarpa]|uniref:Uncharacterized protein n=1 Tax=Phyllosticta citricarpa TaxID=55181 RepID=A0ABR1MPX3_9PEZI
MNRMGRFSIAAFLFISNQRRLRAIRSHKVDVAPPVHGGMPVILSTSGELVFSPHAGSTVHSSKYVLAQFVSGVCDIRSGGVGNVSHVLSELSRYPEKIFWSLWSQNLVLL